MINSIFQTLKNFRIAKTVKRVFNFIGGFFLTACCFFGAYMTFINGWTDLNKVDRFEGIIIEKGITTYQTSTAGRNPSTLNNQAFYMKLEGLNQILAVYSPEQKYDNLDNSLYVGDTIKVFYKHSNLVDKLNLETFQIEKNNQEILNSQVFQGRERLMFYLTIFGGFTLLFLTFYQDRKLKINN
jgi:hypothetical protein